MKRSTHLRLSLMVAALPFAATGCGEPAPTAPQADWEEAPDCTTETAMRTEACVSALERALSTAPRYDDEAQCESAENADCVGVDDTGRRTYMPPLAGFIGGMFFARAVNQLGDAYRRGHRRPYRGYHGATSYPPGTTATQTDTRSRSGFGSTAGRSSGWGG